MRIGLVNVDSKIPNLALMKISAYHKQQGDKVEIYDPLFSKVDRIYASKVFNFTSDYNYFPTDGTEIIRGGSGYDLDNKLPQEIEKMCPDYEIFKHETAMGFTTRGCIRNCEFCIVPKKEGYIHEVADIYEFWRGQSHLMLLDNNLTALPDHFEKICKQLIKEKIKTDFAQGLDIRLINSDMAKILSKVRLWKGQIHFAFDNVNLEKQIVKGIENLSKNGVKPHKQMFYVLIGFNSTMEEDVHRVELIDSLGADPFAMPYNKSNCYQANFTRWVNNRAVFKKTSWADYACTKRDTDQTTICADCDKAKKKYKRKGA